MAEQTVRKAELRIEALKQKRESLVTAAARREAEARLRSAEAEAAAAKRLIQLSGIRSPMAGNLYRLEIRPGSFVNPGDMIAEVGSTEKLRAVIYVDEPELGRVGAGMPVRITWDALPGREWNGTVDTVPTEVVSFGTRQVGQVLGVIDNPDGELPPGANINVEIRSRVAENALTVPKEALRRVASEVGVFVLDGTTVRWQAVELGTSSITRAEVTAGLKETDAVALPTETTLANGDPVTPVFP